MSNPSQRCVAIIGAGVSGLTTAMNMIKVGIQPIVFEKESGIGGLWNVEVKPWWKSIRANLSKFTTVLPDFPWPSNARLFPTQREVFIYLSEFVQQKLPSDIFLFNTQVTNINGPDPETNQWTVQYQTANKETLCAQFDFVVIASGVFARAQIPQEIVGLSSFPGTILHSCDYRSPEQVRGKRVILVGSSISAADIAADMASSAKQIVHIAPNRFWPLARFMPLIPVDPASPFLPVDLVIYRRSTRSTDDEIIFRNANGYRQLNANFRLLVGDDDPASHLTDNDDNPPIYVISDMYTGWTRTGHIVLQHGRLNKVQKNGTLTLDNGTTIDTTCDDVLALCTGYQSCLDFFPPNILEQLSYIPDDRFSPLALHRNVFHPSLPGLAFVGMYRGPIWTIIELQARWVSAVFSGALPIPSVTVQQAGIDIEQRVRAQRPRPQFPHGDILGVINGLAKELGIVLSKTIDIVVAAHYRCGGPDPTVLAELENVCKASCQGSFVARAVYHALHGSKWTFERTITGRPTTATARGKAQFISLEQEKHQLLYTEQDDELTLSSSTTAEKFDIMQKYMYVYDEDNDSLTVYIVEDNNTRGSIFHTIHFEPKASMKQSGWTAIGEHQSNQNHYSVSYVFAFAGVRLSHLDITYKVNGPAKDYVSKTIFRPEP